MQKCSRIPSRVQEFQNKLRDGSIVISFGEPLTESEIVAIEIVESNERSNVVPLPARRMSTARAIVASGEWVKDWVAPDFLIDGLFQRRYVYAMTGPAGTGKTAIALTLAAHVALGLLLGEAEVETGRVLYLAGENPDDILTRWRLLAEHMHFDAATVPVDFLPGVLELEPIKRQARARGPYDLVIVDTSAAYFPGEDENDNVAARKWAQDLRALCELPGGPCVIVAAHPHKSSNSHHEPRGGVAFLNEIDGNTYLDKSGRTVSLNRHEKFRGPEFRPIWFQMDEVISEELKYRNGRPVTGVIAAPMTAERHVQAESKLDHTTGLIAALHGKPGASLAEIATAIGLDGSQDKDRSRVRRELLKLSNFAKQDSSGHWHLTDQGEQVFANSQPNNTVGA